MLYLNCFRFAEKITLVVPKLFVPGFAGKNITTSREKIFAQFFVDYQLFRSKKYRIFITKISHMEKWVSEPQLLAQIWEFVLDFPNRFCLWSGAFYL
jgi:hypothetical protein